MSSYYGDGAYAMTLSARSGMMEQTLSQRQKEASCPERSQWVAVLGRAIAFRKTMDSVRHRTPWALERLSRSNISRGRLQHSVKIPKYSQGYKVRHRFHLGVGIKQSVVASSDLQGRTAQLERMSWFRQKCLWVLVFCRLCVIIGRVGRRLRATCGKGHCGRIIRVVASATALPSY